MIQSNEYFRYDFASEPKVQGVLVAVVVIVGVILFFKPSVKSRRKRYGSWSGGERRNSYTPSVLGPAHSAVLDISCPPLRDGSFIPGAPRSPDLRDPKAQMDAIARVGFETVPLLNREEARLLPILEAATREYGAGHRLMAQTSLGEVIRPLATSPVTGANQAAYASINSKRLDFTLINRRGHLVAAIEYQGSGHHQNNALLRDAVKREALRKAGVPYIKVPRNFDPEEVRSQVRRILQPAPRGP